MDSTELRVVLEKHVKWLSGEMGGERANLQSANLQSTILEKINWLAFCGAIPDANGVARAYKMTKANGEGPFNGGIKYTRAKAFEAPLNPDTGEPCGSGINLATFQWCLNNKADSYRLFMMEFSVAPENICVPIGTDGKFRVAKCEMVGECDWQGNLLPKKAPNG